MKFKNYGYTTKNENGWFEISFEVDSFWRRLFKMRTKFAYETPYQENYKMVLSEYYAAEHFLWVDKKDSTKVISNSVGKNINKVVRKLYASEIFGLSKEK